MGAVTCFEKRTLAAYHSWQYIWNHYDKKGGSPMGGEYSKHYDPAKHIDEVFPQIDSDTSSSLRYNDGGYAELWHEMENLLNDFPVVQQVTGGKGGVSLSPEEHEAMVRYLAIKNEMERKERKQLYLRGHSDNYAYIKQVSGFMTDH